MNFSVFIFLLILIPQSFSRPSTTADDVENRRKASLRLKEIAKQVADLKKRIGLSANATSTAATSTTTPTPPLSEICGFSKKTSNKKIVGGAPADPNDWPWIASIMSTAKIHLCGGSLISDRHILTAAHCFEKYTKEEVIIRLGEYKFDEDTNNIPTDFNVADIRKHPKYDFFSDKNDIALLKLDRIATFNAYILPVCLPPPNNLFDDSYGYVIGWGSNFFGGASSNVLQEVAIPIWRQEKCAKAYPADKIVPTMLCAGYPAGGMDSCQGDSGGPLLVQVLPSPQWHLAGIVSFGTQCGLPNIPGVYTRVNMYLDWIKENSIS